MTTWTKQWWQRGCITVDHVATLASQAMQTRRPMDAMRRMPVIGSMEPMVLFSATPIDPAIMADSDATDPVVTTVMEVSLESESSIESNFNGPIQDPNSVNEATQTNATELIFLDAFVPEIDALLEDIRLNRPDAETFVLDADADGVAQISEILESRVGIRSIQVISHAENSAVRLGNLWLGADNLDAYAGQLAGWNASLTSDADILFFGCDLASDSNGRTLLDAVAAMTGADVAASDNDTGHSRYDADWVLEYATGTIETSVGISESLQAEWQHKLATITVTTLTDEINSNGFTSLREAINQANAGSGGDTIVFSNLLSTPATFTLTRQQSEDDSNVRGDLDILKDVTIIGHGIGQTILDGNSLSRLFDVHAGTLTLSDMTLQHGQTGNQIGGAIRVNDSNAALVLSRANLTDNSAIDGGAIGNLGTVLLTDVSLVNNGSIDGLTTNTGGAIRNDGTATLLRVTMANNTATNGGGYFQGTVASTSSLTNVTFSGNTATNGGGAMSTRSNVNLINSTLTLNTGTHGGGIHIENGTTTILNTIVSGNVGTDFNPDLTGSFVSLGGNLFGNVGTSLNTSSPVSPNRPDLVGQPANLGTLGNHGGYVQTHALLTGSAAIDAGAARFSPATDARGLSSLDGRIDIGAYQANAGHLSRLYWIDEDDDKIMSSNLDGSDIQTVIESLESPDEIFVDSINGHIYWSETEAGGIRRVNLDGTQAQDVLTGLNEPRGIEIDFKNEHIYWIEDGNISNGIRRSDLDGSNTITLITIGSVLDVGYKPNDIAIDYEKEHLYWTDDLSQRVERIDLSGSNRTLIATSSDSVRGVAVDPRNDKLYWTIDGGGSRIHQSDLDGNAEVNLISSGLVSPNGIVVDSVNGKLFWTDHEMPGIFTANLDGTNVTNLNITGLDSPKGIALGVSELNQTPISVSLNGNPLIENTNTALGLQVGTLEVIDLDAEETFTFSITGGSDASHFTLAGPNNDRLILTDDVLDFETQSSYEVTVTVQDSAGNVLNQTLVLGVRNLPELNGLLFGTRDDVADSGVTNLPAWDSDQLLQFGNPDLSFDPNGGSTAGAVSTTGFRLQNFIAETDVALDAMHSVWSGVAIGSGSNSFELLQGDLLFSIDENGITFDSATEPDKTFDKNDVIVFRASTPGDYSTGDFFHLLDDPMSAGDIRGIALVESVNGVHVGDATLAQGTFLLSTSGVSEQDRIYIYQADTVGASNTTGSNQILIEGDDAVETANGGNLGFSVEIAGIHLVESNVTVGGTSLSEGDLLISVQAVGDVATTIQTRQGTNQDVFRLSISSTRVGGNASIATVDLLFDGDDIGLLPGQSEEINGITLVEINEFFPGNTNNAPTLSDWEHSAVAGQPVAVSAEIFQSLADDIDGNSLTAQIIAAPTTGTLTLEPSGEFIYTPTPGFVGKVSFSWVANDGNVNSPPATVTLTFLPLPAPTPSVVARPELDPIGDNGESSDNDDSNRTSESDSSKSSDADSESGDETKSSTSENGPGVPINAPNAATSNAMQTASAANGEQLNLEASANESNRDAAQSGPSKAAQPTDGFGQFNVGTQNNLARDNNRTNRTDLSFEFGSDTSTFSAIDYALMTQPGAMWDELDNYQQRVSSQIQGDLIVVGTAGAAASSVTVGVVAWALRSGLLVSGLIAHIPAWKAVDPLLIMQGFSGSADGETLEELMDRHEKAMANE